MATTISTIAMILMFFNSRIFRDSSSTETHPIPWSGISLVAGVAEVFLIIKDC